MDNKKIFNIYQDILAIHSDDPIALEWIDSLKLSFKNGIQNALNRKEYSVAMAQVDTALTFFKGDSELVHLLQKVVQQKLLNQIEWVWVEGGTFEMGYTSEQSDCDSDEKPVHTVTVDGFYMSKYEITNKQVVEVFNLALEQGKITASSYTVKNAEGSPQELLDLDDSDCQISYNGSRLYVENGLGNYPVVEISWYGAAAFCNYLSEIEGLTPVYDLNDWSCNWSANGCRLPTEAEWEYAARGGQKSRNYKYAGGNNVNEVAWYGGNSGGHTHEVGTKQPNELGLYDMSGNVWEWCWDWYGSNYYSSSQRDNPKGPDSGSDCVRRGGSWSYNAWDLRVANRSSNNPSDSYNDLGFRLLRIH